VNLAKYMILPEKHLRPSDSVRLGLIPAAAPLAHLPGILVAFCDYRIRSERAADAY